MYEIEFRNERIPMIGMGTWCVGDLKEKRQQEITCIRSAIDTYGMTLVDTAEMYGNGSSEEVVGEALAPFPREKLFLVDKILPENAFKGNFRSRVKRSLELTGCDYFDLYLLHWREHVNLQMMVDEMEELTSEGLIRHWGVSNFDVSDMEELFQCRNGSHCFANQFLYNISARGVEFDLIPWCKEHDVLPMIYSPLGDTRSRQLEVASKAEIAEICKQKGISVTNLMLRFVVRNKDLVTIFKTSSIEHLSENLKDVEEGFSEEELLLIDRAYRPPVKKMPLEKI